MAKKPFNATCVRSYQRLDENTSSTRPPATMKLFRRVLKLKSSSPSAPVVVSIDDPQDPTGPVESLPPQDDEVTPPETCSNEIDVSYDDTSDSSASFDSHNDFSSSDESDFESLTLDDTIDFVVDDEIEEFPVEASDDEDDKAFDEDDTEDDTEDDYDKENKEALADIVLDNEASGSHKTGSFDAMEDKDTGVEETNEAMDEKDDYDYEDDYEDDDETQTFQDALEELIQVDLKDLIPFDVAIETPLSEALSELDKNHKRPAFRSMSSRTVASNSARKMRIVKSRFSFSSSSSEEEDDDDDEEDDESHCGSDSGSSVATPPQLIPSDFSEEGISSSSEAEDQTNNLSANSLTGIIRYSPLGYSEETLRSEELESEEDSNFSNYLPRWDTGGSERVNEDSVSSLSRNTYKKIIDTPDEPNPYVDKSTRGRPSLWGQLKDTFFHVKTIEKSPRTGLSDSSMSKYDDGTTTSLVPSTSDGGSLSHLEMMEHPDYDEWFFDYSKLERICIATIDSCYFFQCLGQTTLDGVRGHEARPEQLVVYNTKPEHRRRNNDEHLNERHRILMDSDDEDDDEELNGLLIHGDCDSDDMEGFSLYEWEREQIIVDADEGTQKQEAERSQSDEEEVEVITLQFIKST